MKTSNNLFNFSSRSKIEDFIIVEDLKGLLNHLRDADHHLESHNIFMLEKLALKNTSCIHTAKIGNGSFV